MDCFASLAMTVERDGPIAAVIPAISIMGEDFSAAIATDAPAIAGRRARTGFRNNRKMPLICPTCQVALSNAGARLLLCMGLLSIFWQRAPSKGSSPTSPAVVPAKARCDTHGSGCSSLHGRPAHEYSAGA